MRLPAALRYSLVLFCLGGHASYAEVKLPNIFGSQMVLQQQAPIRVFGSAQPGEKVLVSFAGQQATSTADGQGRWRVNLPPMQASNKPQTMSIQGHNLLELKDILIGEVWICSGQSNMEWWLQYSADAKQEIAAANYPEIRLFDVRGHTTHREPQPNTTGSWQRCTPDSARRFSAVGYFFGRDIFRATQIPVGLIGTNWGGTKIEPWTTPAGFASVPQLKHYSDGLQKLNPTTPEGKAHQREYLGRVDQWVKQAHKKVDQHQPTGVPPAPPNHNDLDGATVIYNSMVHGLAPFSVRGAIWYQGESNGDEGESYYHKMRALINGWRKAFENPMLAFYFVQLANYKEADKAPDRWARLREAQRKTLTVPHTGMAVTTDIGNPTDIHPTNKQDVGNRLALWALRDIHHQKVTPSGPLFREMKVDGKQVHLFFDHSDGGLMVGKKKGLSPTREVTDGKLGHFAIAGADRKWYPASARIQGKEVVVSSPQVQKPVAVRYAFSQNPEGANLYNKAGLPASAFRTDAW